MNGVDAVVAELLQLLDTDSHQVVRTPHVPVSA
jgi:hypothetical protein